MRRATNTLWIGLSAVLVLLGGIAWWSLGAADSAAIATRESPTSDTRGPSAPTVLAEVPSRASTTLHVAAESALPAGHACLKLVVRTRDGDQPIADSKWRVGDVTAVTDAEGKLELAVAAGVEFELLCLAPEILEQRVPALAEREIRELTLRLGPTAADWLRIHVVDGDSGAALANVSFFALSRYVARVDKLDVGARTDAGGDARIDVRRWKPFDALVAAPGYALRAIPVEVDPARPTLELELSPSAPLTVEVAASTEYRAEILVEVEFERRTLFEGNVHGDPAQRMRYESRLDADGRVRFDSLPTGTPLQVFARARQRERLQRTVTLSPRRPTVVAFDFAAPSAVRGVLRADERLLGGVELVLERVPSTDSPQVGSEASIESLTDSRNARTNPDGIFRFEAIPPGTWRIGNQGASPAVFDTATANEWVSVSTRTVNVFGDGRDVEVDLTASVGWSAHGRVVDLAGSPVAGALVWQIEPGDELTLLAKSDRQGEFVTGLIEESNMTLVATADPIPANVLLTLGYDAAFAPWDVGYPSAALRSEPVEAAGTTTDLVLRLPRGARVCGRASGEHDPTSGLTSFSLASATRFHDTLITDEDPPRFCFEGLAPGRYRVVGREERGGAVMLGLSTEFELAAGASLDGVVVPLAPAGYLRDAAGGAAQSAITRRPTCWVEVNGARLTPFHPAYYDGDRLPTPAGHVRILVADLESADASATPRVWCEFDLAPGETRTVAIPEAK